MRVFLFVLLVLCGAVAIFTGLIVPAHLRAVDPFVLSEMPPGKTLVQLATDTVRENPPAAKLLVLAAEEMRLPETETALDALRETRRSGAGQNILARLETEQAGKARVPEVPVLVALRPAAARPRLVESLKSTEARRVLNHRSLTNTTLFAPAGSAAGFPLDAAILTTAFVIEQRSFSPGLHEDVLRLTASSDIPSLEEFYLNILALARRFSSAQIAALVAHIPNAAALDTLSRALQVHPAANPLIYSAVLASRDGGAVANYLRTFPKTAIDDLGLALQRGSAPLKHLLSEGQPVFRSNIYNEFASDRRLRNIFNPLLSLAVRSPAAATLLKFFLLTFGAACIVAASRFARRAEERRYVLYAPFSFVRRAAATLVLLMLLLIMGEPYLAQGGAEEPPRPRVTFSLAALAAPAAPQTGSKAMLDQHTMLAIATFLTLQGLIYAICLVKLAEIRKQPVSSAMKLKLLDNEENLFDGGLYCGLFGTAASLILLTLGVIKPSLISAYSSTLFGILFVALIKIVHVRPYKRRLLLDSTDHQPA